MEAEIVNSAIQNASSSASPSRRKWEGLIPHQFKPGQSGNPAGRPKKVTTALDKAANQKRLMKAALGLLQRAAEGDPRAFETVRETLEGKLPQPVTGGDGGPLEVNVTIEAIGVRK